MSATGSLQRTALLYGDDSLKRFARSRVAIFGVGGVGSWCAEALMRSGIGHLTMVDADDVDVTNINRQLPATTHTVGTAKVEALKRRFVEIAPESEIVAIQKFYSAENAAEFAMETFDVVIDAIDSLASKKVLIKHALGAGCTLFSSMGAARRVDPGAVSVAEFRKVQGCALARALRDRFKKDGGFPQRKFQCVYSTEPIKGEPKGTSMAVTATFGLRLAALALSALAAER